jgi:hypothetical protein
MARGKQTTAELRAAVIAALLAGQGVTEVASRFKLDKSVVSRIKATIPPDQLQQLATKKGEEFGELLADYLRETIITLREQAKYFRTKEWLKLQSASEAAVLHGVCADKALRLLEAIERANEISQEAAEA